MDSPSPDHRSALMKRVKRSDTKAELTLRKELHSRGFRYVIGDRRLPGTPDIAFPKYKAAVFVHGCFWHGHACRQGRVPSSNVDYWVPKIAANRERDGRKEQTLRELGWRVFTVWECQLKGLDRDGLIDALAEQISTSAPMRSRHSTCLFGP